MLRGLFRRNVATLSLSLALTLSTSRALPSTSPEPTPPAGAVAPIKIGGILKDSRAWTTYRERFIDRSGRVVDTGNGNISHSEGQGYGMLLAVAADDRQAFDRLLSWTRANLFVRDDNLAAWRWSGTKPAGSDRNTATDGDLLIAWALAEGADLWDEPAYLELSQAIAEDLVGQALRPVDDFGMVVMPGARGFSAGEQRDGPIVNLSYWIFPAFPRLAQVAPSFDWNGLTATGLALIDAARSGPFQLPPDWLSLARMPAAPAEGFEKRFGYDALRIPLYLFWGGDAAPARASVFAEAWPSSAPGIRLIPFGAAAAPGSAELAEPGYEAVAALARCSAADTPYPSEFYRFRGDQNYYPATLHLLSLIAATVRGGPCLDPAALRSLVSPTWRATSGSLTRLTALTGITAAQKPERDIHADALDSDVRRTEPAQKPELGIAAPASSPAALASVGAELPTTVKASTAGAPMSWSLLGGGVALIAGLAWFGGRRQARRGATPTDVKEREISDAVSAVSQAMGKPRLRIAPRTLPISPFAPSDDPNALGRQIEIAAEACVRLDSKLGLIYFEPPAIAEARKTQGDAAANVIVATLAAELRRWLREADHVEVINQNQIVCCICPLETRQDLESVAKRMCAIVRRMGLAGNGALEAPAPAGLAMYPLDGYSGQELIDNARRDYFHNAQAIASTPTIEPSNGQAPREPKRVKPPRMSKAARRAAANRAVGAPERPVQGRTEV